MASHLVLAQITQLHHDDSLKPSTIETKVLRYSNATMIKRSTNIRHSFADESIGGAEILVEIDQSENNIHVSLHITGTTIDMETSELAPLAELFLEVNRFLNQHPSQTKPLPDNEVSLMQEW